MIAKKHYAAPVKPEAIYMQYLNLTVSPMSRDAPKQFPFGEGWGVLTI